MKYFLGLLFCVSSAFAEKNVSIDVALSPAGSFKAKTSDVIGDVVQDGKSFHADKIIVKLEHLQTGIALRDEHTKKHLEFEKFPEVTLSDANGVDGKGTGKIRIKEIEKEVAGTYKIEKGELVAVFPIKLSDFKIENIRYMGVGVKDSVNINVTVPIVQK